MTWDSNHEQAAKFMNYVKKKPKLDASQIKSNNIFESRDWNSVCSWVNKSLIRIDITDWDEENPTEKLFTEERKTKATTYNTSRGDEFTRNGEMTQNTDRSETMINLK